MNVLKKLGFGILLIALIYPLSSFAQWSDEIKISEGSNPDLDMDWQTGNAYVLAMEGGVLITKIDKNGNILSQEMVTPANEDDGGIIWGASIAVGPNGEPHIIYRDKRSLDYTGYYTYKTPSNTWSTPLLIYEDLFRAWTPRIDVDSQGRAHISYGYGENESIHGHIHYYRVVDGVKEAYKDGMNYFRGDTRHEMCVTPDGEVHLVTGNADYTQNGEVFYYNSLDGGNNWEGRGRIDADDARDACGFVDISQDAQKNFHVAYSSEDARAIRSPGIWYAKLKNNSKVLERLVTEKDEIAEEHLNLGLSSVAASEDGQYVMMTYITGQDGGDLYSRLSTDGGNTWGEKELIATGLNTVEGRSQHFIRAYKHRFYLIYPLRGIQFRYYQIPGFEGPTAEANGPYTGNEGTAIQFTGAGSSDPNGIATYAWDWNDDGIFDDSTASETISHSFTDDYSGNVVLRVRSNDGKMSTDNAAVTVSNVAPSVELGGNKTEDEGTLINFSATVSDPGSDDQLTYAWNFGDGSTSNEQAPDHAFADNGSFSVSLTVSDGDGGQQTDQMTVTVNNVAPTADPGGPYNGRPGENVNLHGSATDPGTADTFTFTWDLDANGSYETSGADAIFNSAQNGVYTVKLKVVDDDGGESVADGSVIIGSAAPVVSEIPSQTIDEGGSFEPIQLDNYVTDPDDPVTALTWHSEGNINLGVTINNRVATISPPNSNWNGQETITFIATDPGGESDSADVLFKVNPVNDPPTVTTIPNQTKMEGTSFDPITLDNFVQDPDHNPMQMNWTVTGNTNLVVTQNNRVVTIAPADSEWAGTENLTFQATDPEGANSQQTASFTVIPVNDPPQITNFPDQDLYQYQQFPTINLDDCVFDPDHASHLLSWTFFGNINLDFTIVNRVVSIQAKNPDWYGVENVTFVATDPGNLQTSKVVKFTVHKVDARPGISTVPNQTINEGEAFSPINFDNYVNDLNNTPSEISWSNFGQVELQVNWAGHVATIVAPTTEWSGSETISFVATDPDFLKDTTAVIFTVTPVNDPPTISGVSNITFEEDGAYDLSFDLLRQYSADPDHPTDELEFGLKNNVNILFESQTTSNQLHIFTRPNFSGTENVSLFVKDPEGATGEQPLQVTVVGTPDPVGDFDIIRPKTENLFVWPPTKDFSWHAAHDPDAGDMVYYRWLLSRTIAFSDTFNTKVLSDTFYTHIPTRRMPKGNYFWKVIAQSTDGSKSETSVGTISTALDNVEKAAGTDMPTEFALLPNHPNPFNPETLITYQVAKQSPVKISVFNSLGQQVRQLVNETKSRGTHSIYWNAMNDAGQPVSSGIYICRMEAGGTIKFIKMILMQ